MALESFYGGKPGYSPIIKGTFKSIEEMDSHFKSPEYTDIWYGELCIITPDSMYDADNGKIFRRTLKKQFSSDSTYGSLYAEYLGQIVGMPGGLPKVIFNTIDNVKNIPSQEENRNKDIWYPTGSDNGYIETSNDKSITNFAILNGSEAEGIEFVPGMQKDSNNNITYNDNFEYTWLQIADPQSNTAESDGTRGTLHLGLKIPYMYLDAPTVTPVSYFNDPEIIESNIGSDYKQHTFYKKYNFYIPDGIRGVGISNLRIETKESLQGKNILDPTVKNFFTYDSSQRNIVVKNDAFYNLENYSNNNPFWVYDLNVPNKTDEDFTANSYICYAGDYKEITDITLNNDGTFTFDTGYDTITTDNAGNKVKWITSTTIGVDPDENNYGQFTINYNTGDPNTYNLPLVKNIVAYSDISNDNEDSNDINNAGEKIKVELADGTGTRNLTLLKSTGQDSYEEYKLKYPRSLAITTHDNSNFVNEEDKDPFYYLTVTYNDGKTTEELGPVGVQNVDDLASYIAVGEEKTIVDQNTSSNITTVEKISNYLPEVVQKNAIMLINENITFDSTLSFLPSFSLENATT